jgi:hypothetical protein
LVGPHSPESKVVGVTKFKRKGGARDRNKTDTGQKSRGSSGEAGRVRGNLGWDPETS